MSDITEVKSDFQSKIERFVDLKNEIETKLSPVGKNSLCASTFRSRCKRYLKEVTNFYQETGSPYILKSLDYITDKMDGYITKLQEKHGCTRDKLDRLTADIFLEINKNSYKNCAHKLMDLLDKHNLADESKYFSEIFNKLNKTLEKIDTTKALVDKNIVYNEIEKYVLQLSEYVKKSGDPSKTKSAINEVLKLLPKVIAATAKKNEIEIPDYVLAKDERPSNIIRGFYSAIKLAADQSRPK